MYVFNPFSLTPFPNKIVKKQANVKQMMIHNNLSYFLL